MLHSTKGLQIMFNISLKKVGGIVFIGIGRINLSFSVSSKAGYAAKRCRVAGCDVVREMVSVERLCADVMTAARNA